MPILGYEMVVQCRDCEKTARLRVIDGADSKAAVNPFKMVISLLSQGFVFSREDYACQECYEAPEPEPESIPEPENGVKH